MKKLKFLKEGLFLIPAVVIAAGAAAGYWGNIPVFPKIPALEAAAETFEEKEGGQEQTDRKIEKTKENEEKDESAKERKKVTYTGSTGWKDGTYLGEGRGFGGAIRVQVTIKEGRITKITILSHAGETPQYFNAAKAVLPRIVSGQTPNVNAVSGATFSSNGILEAVIHALKKAETDSGHTSEDKKWSEEEPEKNDDTGQDKDKEKDKDKHIITNKDGQPADGVFSGSAVCNPFGYTIRIKVKFKDGKAVALYGLKISDNPDPQNEAYWKKAWKPIVQRILKRQEAEVDAVSGATYSSRAMMEAYAAAYAKAVKKNDPDAGKDAEEEIEKSEETEETTDTQDEKETEDTEVIPLVNLKDGIYRVSTLICPDEGEDFFEYVLEADAVVSNGVFTGFENIVVEDPTNRMFCTRALEGTENQPGILQQLIKKQDASGLDAITGATCSSDGWIALFLEMIKLAA